MVAVIIVLGVAALLVGFAFIKSNLKVCPPNEVLIFSGRKRKLPDGTAVGYRVIKGGRGFRIPIVETVKSMSLETIPVKVELSDALSRGLIPLDVEAIANVKIAGTEEEGLSNAIERFLGRSQEEIARVARQTLEGALRGVLATMTPEEANTDRLNFARRVREEVASDFRRLGLVIDTFRIQKISDKHHYLEAIARKKNAQVQRDARIAEAQAEAEAREVSAEARRRGEVAEIEAKKAVVEAENEFRVKKAGLEAKSSEAESRAQVAGEIARVREEKILEEERVELNRRRYQADVVVPAEAEMEAQEMKARGEAARVVETGKATAEAVKLMRQEWEKGETKDLFLIQLLPEIIEKITSVVSSNLSIERLTVVDGGDGQGVPALVKSLTGSVVAVMEQLKSAAGIDIAEILKSRGAGASEHQR